MDTLSISKANELMRTGKYKEAQAVYEHLLARNHPLSKVLTLNLENCKRLQSKTWAHSLPSQPSHQMLGNVGTQATHAAKASTPPPIYITLTTIDSRLQHLRKVLESLHQQDLPPQEIRLYISEEPYLLDKGIPQTHPIIQSFADLPLLRVHWVKNTGPYRKIVPFVEEHFSKTVTTDKLFITVDDDTLYPSDFISKLYANYQQHHCVIAYRGRDIVLDGKAVAEYSKWGWGRTEILHSGLPTGKDGVFYCTRFFTKAFINLDAAIKHAPTADDLWIKWHCGMNGVPSIILNPEACTSDYKSFPVVDYSKEYRGNSLFANYNSSSSHGKNDTSVKNLETLCKAEYGYTLADMIGQ